MNMQTIKSWCFVSLIIALLGCSRTDLTPPAALPLDQIKPVVEEAFADAASDIKAGAAEYVELMLKPDMAGALAKLQQLQTAPGLNPRQRTTLARAMMTTTRELQNGADGGDQQAAQALHDYKSRK